MKKRITPNEIHMLSKKGKDTLNSLWEPKAGDLYVTYTTRVPKYETTPVKKDTLLTLFIEMKLDNIIENRFIDHDKDMKNNTSQYHFVKPDAAYPLLSIGDMIELITKLKGSIDSTIKDADTLCDNLWNELRKEIN